MEQELLDVLQTMSERLVRLESAIQRLEARLNIQSDEEGRTEQKRQMKEAAILLKDDYANDKELTVFTALDGEDFYEPE